MLKSDAVDVQEVLRLLPLAGGVHLGRDNENLPFAQPRICSKQCARNHGRTRAQPQQTARGCAHGDHGREGAPGEGKDLLNVDCINFKGEMVQGCSQPINSIFLGIARY